MAETVKTEAVKEQATTVFGTDVAETIIDFYNHRTLCDVSTTAKRSQNVVVAALEKAHGDIALLKEHIKVWVENNDPDDYDSDEDRFKACFVEFTPEVPINKETFTVTDSLSLISKVVTDAVKATCLKEVESDVKETLQDEVRTFISNEYGPIERKVILSVNDNKADVKGVLHEKFEDVLKYVAHKKGVFLVGPAGSGKNHLCKQVADALGLKFYFSNAVTQEYKITGFTDANGNYQPTQFYKAFTEGGLFMLDEIDASIPEVLNILNAAMANRYFDFPAPIGYVEAHPNFRVIAAGNTSGHGADNQYVGRNQLDGASLDRFAEVRMGYCPEIENALANNDLELADFCRAFRAESKKAGVDIIVSYRAISNIADMKDDLPLTTVLRDCLVKDLESHDLYLCYHNLPETKYKSALEEIYADM